MKPTEQRFEELIENSLNQSGYESRHFSMYDRDKCLIPSTVIEFIKDTQPEKFDRLHQIYGDRTESQVLTRITSEITKRGLIDVLRKPIIDRGVYLDLCYFEPNSDLNPEHKRLSRLNKFELVRQLHYSKKNENSLDMVLFLNGLPVITMELKNQLTGQNVKNSENQYRHDRDPKELIFNFKRCIVHFCVDNNNVSMTTKLAGLQTFFLPFNQDLENPPVYTGYRTKYLWEDILDPSSLLDILENFVHLSKEKEFFFNTKAQSVDMKVKELLVFPRYHQLDLIRKLRRDLTENGVGKNYLIQHTTGSGKSYSIGWLSHTLTSLYRSRKDTKRIFDTVIVVTDRTVLDDQLRNTIRSLEKVEGVVNGVEHGSQELRKFLEQGKDIVVTTIQKFPFISETIASLNDRTFGVIIDEVHSSQSGELSKELKKSLSKTVEEVDGEFDYEEMLRKEIESRGHHDHISFFGFTGTPKEKTLEIFGTRNSDGTFEPFHHYTMKQSIYEKFTLDVLKNYTTFKRYFKVKKITDDEIEVPTGEGTKQLVRYVDSHEQTIEYKVRIILDHWISKGSKEIQGRSRGMIVTQSRKHCVQYFFEVNKQLAERNINYQSLVGFSGEVSLDGEKYTEYGLNQTIGHEGDVPLGLKNPQYRLLIVANKFQTGFDEPLVQSMYVDKKLGGVQCVQTLSRLNRTTSGKDKTFVLDFVNSPEEIHDSFQRFYTSTVLEGETDQNSLYDAKREIEDTHIYTSSEIDRFCKVFFDPDRVEGELHPPLDAVVDRFIQIDDEEFRESIRTNIQKYIRMYGYLSQILTFEDIELEKSFVFLKYLNKKLPKRDRERVDISDDIELHSLRIQKIHESMENLEDNPAILSPPTFGSDLPDGEPEKDYLSAIVEMINQRHGSLLTEDDKVVLRRMEEEVQADPEIRKFMEGDSSDDNKKHYFNEQLEGRILDYLNDRFDFFKKLDENQAVKNMIFSEMYRNYKFNPASPDRKAP